jgi:hypothetical protein
MFRCTVTITITITITTKSTTFVFTIPMLRRVIDSYVHHHGNPQ